MRNEIGDPCVYTGEIENARVHRYCYAFVVLRDTCENVLQAGHGRTRIISVGVLTIIILYIIRFFFFIFHREKIVDVRTMGESSRNNRHMKVQFNRGRSGARGLQGRWVQEPLQ